MNTCMWKVPAHARAACAEDKARYERELQENPEAQRRVDKGKTAKARAAAGARLSKPKTKASVCPTRAVFAGEHCSVLRML